MTSMFSKDNAAAGPAAPIPSSTVILVRDVDGGGFEIFLMRRHRKSDFMGGAYVFPGGRLDEEDRDPELARYAGGMTAAEAKKRLMEPGIDENTAMGLHFAAIRETFEEAGVLLARSKDGKTLNLDEPGACERFGGYRDSVHKKEISLKELAEREGLTYALDRIAPYSHWITPEVEKKRFDTRFFIARTPRKQSPVHCNVEMTESLWVTAGQALARNKKGKILLMPPTLKTMEEMEAHKTADTLFDRPPADIPVILPQGFLIDGCFGVKLPFDPEYTIEGYKMAPRSGEPSRIIMKDGLWRTVIPGPEK